MLTPEHTTAQPKPCSNGPCPEAEPQRQLPAQLGTAGHSLLAHAVAFSDAFCCDPRLHELEHRLRFLQWT